MTFWNHWIGPNFKKSVQNIVPIGHTSILKQVIIQVEHILFGSCIENNKNDEEEEEHDLNCDFKELKYS